MSLLPASSIGDESTGFYNGVATTSLRFDEGSNSNLTFTPSSAGSQKICTISVWVKRSSAGSSGATEDTIFHAGTALGNRGHLRFYEDKIDWEYYNGSWIFNLRTTGVFRDTSAWYHICGNLDTVAGTAKLWVNGVEVALSESTIPSSSQDTTFGDDIEHQIGFRKAGNAGYFHGYIADLHFIDGSDLDYSQFAEFKNGVLIPKKYTGSYGTNGFRLEFKQTGTGTASSSTIGADTSGNGNHFTSNNLSAHDVVPDCPENNFCVMKSASVDHQNRGTPSDGNLVITNAGSAGWGVHTATFAVNSGKWWYEACASGSIGIGYNVGYQNVDTYHNATTDGKAVGSFFFYGTTSSGAYYYVGTSDSGTVDNDIDYGAGTTFVVGDVLGIALDLDADPPTVQHYVNGSAVGSAREIPEGNTLTPYLGLYSANAVTTFNFGADPTFGGISVDGSSADATDSEGNGKFYDTPPSGFLALCSANLPELAISPAQSTQATDHFNTVLYTGNGTSQSITGVGFQPDWVWFKSRDDGSLWHFLLDSSRGGGARLYSNGNGAEVTNTNRITSFDADGFSVGSAVNVNANNDPIVAWNWKANGGTTTTNDASATSVGTIDSVYQANTTAGFSIVLYNGTGANGTIAHGLSSAPEMVIYKSRDTAQNWVVYHKDVGNAHTLYLDLTNGKDSTTGTYNSTDPTSTVLSVGDSIYANRSGDKFVAYAFHGVEGYSKMDKYLGNGSTDGSFVYTGFRPAWVMIKSTGSSTNGWYIYDNKRLNFGTLVDGQLYANLSNAEDDGNRDLDFLSNGFKPRLTDTNVNGSGTEYIYMAFAEQPFKFSNAK